jgi:LysR family glycine cleavage system transcriptional activator
MGQYDFKLYWPMPRKMPSLTALRAFEAAARHQSFTLAARELFVTHAAISRQVRRLERDMGLRLFQRAGNRVSLTAPGVDLRAVVASAFDAIAAGARRVADAHAHRRLVLTVDPGLAQRWLNARLAAFHRMQPDVDVEIIPTLELVGFPNDAVDAAIHYAFADPPAGLRWVHLIRVAAFPVCAPALLDDLRAPADLARHRLLHEQDTSWWRRWLARVGETGVDWSKGLIYRDSGLVLDAAASGQGVAIGDNLLAYEELAAGRLVRPFAATLPSGSYYLIMADGATRHPNLPAFEAWLIEQFQAQVGASARFGGEA